MPEVSTTTLINWQGLQIEVTPDGDLGAVVAQGSGRRLLDGLRLDLPEPWQRGTVEVLATEVEQQWAHPSGVTAVTRQVFDETWTVRVTLLNRGEEAADVPAPRLRLRAPWPTRRWLAGGEASISIDAGQDGRQLVLTQLRGHATARDGEMLLAPDPLRLAAATDQGPAQFLISWRAAWLESANQAARVLPAWWPSKVALPSGEEVILGLPDAGVSADKGVELVTQDEDTWISGPIGRHVVHVHDRLGVTDLELWWAPPIEHAVHRRASELIEVTDPRTCLPWEAWIVANAVPLLGSPAQEYLLSAAEERLARSGPAHPMDALVVASQLTLTPDDDLWSGLLDLVGEMPTQPGSQLALIHTRLLAMQQGRVTSVPKAAPAPADLSAVERALVAVEEAVLMPPDQPDETMWQVAGLLGAGLPGDTVGLVRLAQVYATTALLPEHWNFLERWPVPLNVARESVANRVLASLGRPEGDEALAWLLAGLN